MNLVAQPKYVCIDSSVLNKMAKDWDGTTHPPLDTELAERGWILLISASHIFEMAAYEDEEAVEKRLRFIRSFGIIAWIKPIDDTNEFLGMPLDIIQREMRVIADNPELTAFDVLDKVRSTPNLIQIGSGMNALKLLDIDKEGWLELLGHVKESQVEARERFSLVQMKVIKDSKIDKRDSLKGRFRTKEERDAYYEKLKVNLTEELKIRGDKKLSDSDFEGLADYFVSRITDDVNPEDYNNSVVNYVAQSYGLPEEKVLELKKIKRISEYYVFFSWLAHSLPDLTEEERLKIPEDSVPCWIIHRALDRHRQNDGAVQGSTEYDENFLWLSMYCDLIFVDRQTKDNCRRASSKDELFNSLICDIEKANNQSSVLKVLDNK